MSWVNLQMYMLTIPETKSNGSADDEKLNYIKPENEADLLKKYLN